MNLEELKKLEIQLTVEHDCIVENTHIKKELLLQAQDDFQASLLRRGVLYGRLEEVKSRILDIQQSESDDGVGVGAVYCPDCGHVVYANAPPDGAIITCKLCDCRWAWELNTEDSESNDDGETAICPNCDNVVCDSAPIGETKMTCPKCHCFFVWLRKPPKDSE